MKVCRTCLNAKPLECFAKAGTSQWTGAVQHRPDCKDCVKARERVSGGRVHFDNATSQACPHGGGVRKVPIIGWGYRPCTGLK